MSTYAPSLSWKWSGDTCHELYRQSLPPEHEWLNKWSTEVVSTTTWWKIEVRKVGGWNTSEQEVYEGDLRRITFPRGRLGLVKASYWPERHPPQWTFGPFGSISEAQYLLEQYVNIRRNPKTWKGVDSPLLLDEGRHYSASEIKSLIDSKDLECEHNLRETEVKCGKGPRIESASYDQNTGLFTLRLRDGVLLSFEAKRLKGLAGASDADLSTVAPLEYGRALQVEALDCQYELTILFDILLHVETKKDF